MLSPIDLGAPLKFAKWRKGQMEALDFILETFEHKRFAVACVPTGAGKSLIYTLLAQITGMSTVALTANKPLQDQLMGDFKEIGMVDIRGQSNYPCHAVRPGQELHREFGQLDPCTVDSGPCHGDVACSLKKRGCSYYDAVRIACRKDLVVSNYQWWFSSSKYSGSGGQVAPRAELLICDEAHAAPEELARAVSIRIGSEMLGRYADWKCDDWQVSDWQNWSVKAKALVNLEIERLYSRFKSRPRDVMHDLRVHQDLLRKIDRMASIDDLWVPEVTDLGLDLAPVWPRREAERWLFRQAKRVLLISATNSRRVARHLGISGSEMSFLEVGSDFPIKRRPIYGIANSPRLNKDSSKGDKKRWVTLMDQFSNARMDRSGLIHSISYERSKLIQKTSKSGDRFLSHTSKDSVSTIRRFKDSSDRHPILISPSVSTGFDFPYRECEFAIVAKIPFPDTRSKIMQARIKKEKGYDLSMAANELAQMVGRAMRANDDQCESAIFDGHVTWFIKRVQHLLPLWFLEAYQEVWQLPKPLSALTR